MPGDVKASILVVEDENVVALDIEASLERLGYGVAGVAARGEEAVDMAARVHTDLVLMDIHLRGDMDGIRATELIQEQVLVPVVYLTAYSDDATLDRARLSYPFGYLVKPYTDRELEVAIQVGLHRHRVESALRESEARTRSILWAAQDAIFCADRDGIISEWNRAAEDIFGYAADDIIGQRVTLLLPERSRERYQRELARHRQPGELGGVTVELEGLRRSGEVFPMELSLSGWTNEGETYLSGIVRDISERRRAEAERERLHAATSEAHAVLQHEVASQTGTLQRLAREVAQKRRYLHTALEQMRIAKEHAERASRVKTTFLNMVSHELRTPLATLKLNLERARLELAQFDETRLRQCLDRMEISTDTLHELVDRVLHQVQIQSGRLPTELEMIDVGELAADVVDELRPKAADKKLPLELTAAADLPPLESDPRLVRIALFNLVSNAIKFTDSGTIAVSCEHAGGYHRIAVRDTGPGIQRERQMSVFDAFKQHEPVASKQRVGLGLGLTLVRELIGTLGGRVTLESQVGQGSTFTILLPDAVSH